MRDVESREILLKRFLDRRSGLVDYQIENYVNGKYAAENADSALFNITIGCLYLTACKYSLGYSRSALNSAINETIAWYNKTSGKLYARTSHETYYQHLMLVSLAILLEMDDADFRDLAGKWQEYEIADALIDGLIGARLPEYRVSQNPFLPAVYGGLNELLRAGQYDMLLLKKYLKDWYGKHKNCHWYGSHNQKGPAYFGYWSFESAAVFKVRNKGCAPVGLGQYFPYGMLSEEPEVLEMGNVFNLANVGNGRVYYPGLQALSFACPPTLIDQSKDRLSIISNDGKLEIAGTVFRKSQKTLMEFAKAKSESVVQKMPWYEQISDWASFEGLSHLCLQSAYQGYWPEENESTYYLVLVIDLGDYIFSLSFTGMAKDFSLFKPVVEAFLAGMRYRD